MTGEMEPAIATAAASLLAFSATALFRSRAVRGGVSADRGAPLDGMIAETEQRRDAARENEVAKYAAFQEADRAAMDALARLNNTLEKAYTPEIDSELPNLTPDAAQERVYAAHRARIAEDQLQLNARVVDTKRAMLAHRRAIKKTNALRDELRRMYSREQLNRQLRDRRDEDDYIGEGGVPPP